MEALHCEADGGGGGSGGDRVVFLHMGVDGGATEFKLECRAMNEVTKAGRQRQAFCLFLCRVGLSVSFGRRSRFQFIDTHTCSTTKPPPRRTSGAPTSGSTSRGMRPSSRTTTRAWRTPTTPTSTSPPWFVNQSVSQPVGQSAMITVRKGAAGRTQPFTVLTFIHFTQPDTALFHIPPTEPSQPRRGSCGPRAGP